METPGLSYFREILNEENMTSATSIGELEEYDE